MNILNMRTLVHISITFMTNLKNSRFYYAYFLVRHKSMPVLSKRLKGIEYSNNFYFAMVTLGILIFINIIIITFIICTHNPTLSHIV